MRRIGTLLVAAAAFGAVTAPRLFAGDDPAAPVATPEEAATAARLVEDLGSADFRVREAATKALTELGAKARPALEKAVKSENPAVRFRADQLLQALDGTKGERPLDDGARPSDGARKGADATRRQLEESMRGLRERWGAGRFDEQLKALERQMEAYQKQLEEQFGAAGGGFGPDVEAWVRRFGAGGPGVQGFPGFLGAAPRRLQPDLVETTDAGTWTLRERPSRATLTFRPKADPSATAVYTARDLDALFAAWPEVAAKPGVVALRARQAERKVAAERAEAEARSRAETPGGAPASGNRSVQIESTPDHVKVTVSETGPDGKTVTKTYEGKDLETLKAEHPELEGVVGGMTFRFHAGPGGFHLAPNGGGVIFGPGAGPRPLEEDDDAPSDLDDDAEPATGPFGLALAPVPGDLRAHLGLAEGRGALVMAVRAGSDAEKLGLRVHDVIVKVNGADVKALEEVGAAIRAVPAGGALAVEVQRGGAAVTLTR